MVIKIAKLFFDDLNAMIPKINPTMFTAKKAGEVTKTIIRGGRGKNSTSKFSGTATATHPIRNAITARPSCFESIVFLFSPFISDTTGCTGTTGCIGFPNLFGQICLRLIKSKKKNPTRKIAV